MLERPEGFGFFHNSKKERLKLEMYKSHIKLIFYSVGFGLPSLSSQGLFIWITYFLLQYVNDISFLFNCVTFTG
jgi:hypothetical protein